MYVESTLVAQCLGRHDVDGQTVRPLPHFLPSELIYLGLLIL